MNARFRFPTNVVLRSRKDPSHTNSREEAEDLIKILGILAIILSVSLIASTYQPSVAAPYTPLDSNFKYVKERIIKPIPGKSLYWSYLLKVCADDHSLAITEIILKSDMETLYQGVNKIIPKGKCSHYGAVMKAKDSKTLGYKITQTHEAVEKLLAYKQGKPGISLEEVSRYRFILNIY